MSRDYCACSCGNDLLLFCYLTASNSKENPKTFSICLFLLNLLKTPPASRRRRTRHHRVAWWSFALSKKKTSSKKDAVEWFSVRRSQRGNCRLIFTSCRLCAILSTVTAGPYARLARVGFREGDAVAVSIHTSTRRPGAHVGSSTCCV